MATSFKPEVIADSSGQWCGNALRFATHDEAYASATNLAMRWFSVREWRAVESDDPVTHAWVDGGLVDIRTPDAAPYYAPLSVRIDQL